MGALFGLIISGAIFYYSIVGTMAAISVFLLWISNGFSFRKTRDALDFMEEIRLERKAQQRYTNQRLQQEYQRKRAERLGW